MDELAERVFAATGVVNIDELAFKRDGFLLEVLGSADSAGILCGGR